LGFVLLYTPLTIINFNLTHFSFSAGEAISTPKTNDNSKQEITRQTQISKFILSQEDLLHNNKCSPMFMQGPMLKAGPQFLWFKQRHRCFERALFTMPKVVAQFAK